MGLKLNRVDDEHILENLPFEEEMLDSARLELQQLGPNADRCYEVGEWALTYALDLYQQERPASETLELLAEAAEMMLRNWELRTEHQGGGFMDAASWHEVMSLAITFGSVSNRARIVAVPDAVVYEYGPEGTADALLVRAIRHWLGTGELGEPYEAALARFGSKAASRWETRLLLPAAEGLAAVANGDDVVWNKSLAAMTAEHKHQALRGNLQRSAQAFINLKAIWLLRLGLDRGMQCSVDSPYLPIPLVEAACRRFSSPS